MSRNLKREYLQKLASITTANGYKVDLANYIYNPSLDNEYPAFYKATEEGDKIAVTKFYFFKYHDGTGEYFKEIYERLNNEQEWQVVKTREKTAIKATAKGEKFSLKTLQEFTETIG